MNEPYVYREPRRNAGAGTLAAMLLAVVVGAALLGVFVHRARTGLAGRLAALIAGRSLNMISAPDVVERVQRLNRLESVVYSLDTVIETNESTPLLPDMLAGDRLLMIVHGQTLAGVDLSKLKPEDVHITDTGDGRAISITLPPSEIFLTTIDEGRSRVYSRDTGLLVKADPNLETVARQKAQAELQSAALKDGILDTARANAKDTMGAMLHGLGFRDVDVK